MIPYTKPNLVGTEISTLQNLLQNPAKLSGNGPHTKKAAEWLRQYTQASSALLTTSCTAALEMSALLLELQPGDEVIMPSFTFVSTANAIALRGATPVFVDVNPITLNMSVAETEKAITSKTKALFPIHYAGLLCEMDSFKSFAQDHRLSVLVDAAQAVGTEKNGRSILCEGDLVSVSFHDTKNIHCGEGGALLVNNPLFKERAEIIWEKGTNRSRFLRGEVDKYTWVDLGSSFLMSDIQAAFLYEQLLQVSNITQNRLAIWNQYFDLTQSLEKAGFIERPHALKDKPHNGHIFWVLIKPGIDRQKLLNFAQMRGVQFTSHYVPLHNSPAGKKWGRTSGTLNTTTDICERLLRFPLWPGFKETSKVVEVLYDFFKSHQ